MAKGYPDYFGQSIWPKYGTLLYEHSSFNIIVPATTILYEKISQGVLGYAEIRITDHSNLSDPYFSVYIDGSKMHSITLLQLIEQGALPGSHAPLVCRYANKSTLDFEYTVELGHDLPFRTSIKIDVLTALPDDFFIALGFGCYTIV